MDNCVIPSCQKCLTCCGCGPGSGSGGGGGELDDAAKTGTNSGAPTGTNSGAPTGINSGKTNSGELNLQITDNKTAVGTNMEKMRKGKSESNGKQEKGRNRPFAETNQK